MKQIKGMQLGAVLAAVLLLSMAFVPAVTAQTEAKVKDNNPGGDVGIQGGIGLGSLIDTTLSGSGVTSSTTIWIPAPVLRWLRLYGVTHNGNGQFNADVYRLPLGSYDIGVIFPSGMSVDPNSATGATYVGPWVNGYNSYHFHKDGWFVGTINLKVPVTFNAGYGSHGIITAGGSDLGVLTSFFTGIAASVEGLLAGAVSAGTVAVLLTAAAVSGANVDLLYFNEG